MISSAHPAPDPLLGLLTEAREELARGGALAVPPISGLPPVVLARALYRDALSREPWGPFVHVHTRHLGGAPLSEATLAQSASGWLFVEGPGAEHLARPLVDTGPRAVLWEVPGPGLALSDTDAAHALHLDALHAAATDPALAAVRRALLAHCRAAGAVHIAGESGTGRVALARWAHASLDDRPLSWIRAGQGSLRPGEWALFEEPADLHPEQREALARQVEPEPPEPPRRRGPAAERPRHPALRPILGRSAALAEVLSELLRVAPTELPVLITGEPGTGKESLARAVHAASGRSGPLIALDVGALPEELAESELFGHRRGAFTGADRPRPGAFRAAHGGTLFLDELGNLPARLQVKLLRVLQERQVQPIGEDSPSPVDVRLVAATNADLGAMVRRGSFRADLLGRLDAVTLRLPPLRERLDDLDLLAAGPLGERPNPWCTEEARQILLRHRWPGNVRELGNVLRYAAALCPPGQPIAPEHLGPLSPRAQRRAPTLVVSNGSTEGWGLDRRALQALTVSTLTVPPLRARGEASLRAAVLGALGGRPIRSDALDLLCRLPWWGNQPELDAFAAALSALPPGPLDREALCGLLPHLDDSLAEAPIFVVLLPALDDQGRLGGLIREVQAGAALIGRVRHLRELSVPDPRLAAARSAVEALAGDASVGLVDLSLLPQISRAHLLLTRGGAGLRVHALPGAGLPALAGGLQDDGLRPCDPTHPVELGVSGEVSILSRTGDAVVRLYVFLGELALAEHGPTAAARAAAARAALDLTQDARPLAAAPVALAELPAEAREGPGNRIWTLTAPEQEALRALLVAYEGGQLKAHIQAGVERWASTPELRRLSRYLEEAPRLSQYLSRLVEHEENAPLRDALAASLLGLPDAETRLQLLPKGLRDAVLARASLPLACPPLTSPPFTPA